ncbi:response regulator [Corynebacterium gottingense]|uniref:response regulator n=1 Tax=Corynebacterium gottingense TaxID=2041036 RepID=UPI0038D03745
MSEHTAQVKVLLVDDDPEVLSSFRQYFATTKDIRVVAEAHDGVEALTVLDNVPLDIILADIHMPEMDGVKLLHEVRRRTDPPPFVAITAFDGDETMLRVLAGGGAGYIVKSSRPQAIISAVRDALTGGITVSPQALSRLVDYIPDNVSASAVHRADSFSAYKDLTKVEARILHYICQGLSNAEIASAMKYSEATVKKHVSHLIARFGATSRLSLAITVIQSKLGKSW